MALFPVRECRCANKKPNFLLAFVNKMLFKLKNNKDPSHGVTILQVCSYTGGVLLSLMKIRPHHWCAQNITEIYGHWLEHMEGRTEKDHFEDAWRVHQSQHPSVIDVPQSWSLPTREQGRILTLGYPVAQSHQGERDVQPAPSWSVFQGKVIVRRQKTSEEASERRGQYIWKLPSVRVTHIQLCQE